MADYRQWYDCKKCGAREAISAFGGTCSYCRGAKEEAYVASIAELYNNNQEEAIRQLARQIYYLRRTRA